MTGEAIRSTPHRAKVRGFRYPEAPWDAGSIRSAGLFREIGDGQIEVEFPEALPLGADGPVEFEYPMAPGYEVEPDMDSEGGAPQKAGPESANAAHEEERTAALAEEEERFQDLLALECRRAEERGRDRGREAGLEQGRLEGREETERRLRQECEGERQRLAAQAAALLRSFAETRENYRRRLEEESARLALAIAARILRREALADPLLVTGAVRVALGQLAASTAVRMRVPEADLALWRESMAYLPNLPIRPEVVGDARMEPGDCRLETELGSADLGLSWQLQVLERGMFAGSESGEDRVTATVSRGGDASDRSLG